MRAKARVLGTALAIALVALLFLHFWRGSIATQARVRSSTIASQGATNRDNRTYPMGQPPNAPPPKVLPIAADGTVEVPSRFRLPGVARVRTASSWRDWITQFPASAQEKITAFGKRHFGVFSVNSSQQVAWMAENGYPLPEDIIAAEKLSDADLRELANRGNDKAGFLLHERNIDALQAKYALYAERGQSRQQFWESDPDAQRMQQENEIDRKLMQQSLSPFKGYVQAQEAALIPDDPVGTEAKVIGGLSLAEYLGDSRSNQFALTYVGSDPARQAIYMALIEASANQIAIVNALRGSDCTLPIFSNTIPWNGNPIE